jgi:heme/copper-type cytochrome/quinol oxidase subunit 3
MSFGNTEAIRRREDAQQRVRVDGAALDVAELPSFGFGHRSLMWWGTLGMMAIEGTVFALAVATYFYLRSQASVWPLHDPPPALLWGTLNTVILIASLWPNHLAKKAAERMDLGGARLWVWVCIGFGIAILGVRVLEFANLNTRWDADAYGSIVFTLLGLHTLHLATDTYDTVVLGVLLVTGPMEGQRYVDVSENALYWIFVVLTWLPIYAVLYGAARIH